MFLSKQNYCLGMAVIWIYASSFPTSEGLQCYSCSGAIPGLLDFRDFKFAKGAPDPAQMYNLQCSFMHVKEEYDIWEDWRVRITETCNSTQPTCSKSTMIFNHSHSYSAPPPYAHSRIHNVVIRKCSTEPLPSNNGTKRWCAPASEPVEADQTSNTIQSGGPYHEVSFTGLSCFCAEDYCNDQYGVDKNDPNYVMNPAPNYTVSHRTHPPPPLPPPTPPHDESQGNHIHNFIFSSSASAAALLCLFGSNILQNS